MAKKRDFSQEAFDLVEMDNYDIVQIYNDGDEEPYEGCVHNLYMVLDSDETKVKLLDETDPHARQGHKTYSVEYPCFGKKITLIIWESKNKT